MQGLQSQGLIAGQNITISGINFTWPNVTPDLYNNYHAAGQTIPVTPVPNTTTLGFLGATTGVPNGQLSGTATITYTDNSTQTFTLGFEDWCSNTISSLPNGSSVIATMPYRNTQSGQQTAKNYVYTMSVTLQAGKTVKNVTLPTTSGQGAIHIFAIGTK